MRKFFASLIFLPLLFSCTSSRSGKALLPSVSGKAGEILVVMEKPAWEGDLGNAVRELLASDCPYLAQREPLYSLVNVVPSGFASIFQVHRNLIIFNVDPQGAAQEVKYLQDIWARPQCVIQVNAATDEGAMALLCDNSSMILNTIEQAERDRVIANTMLYENKDIASSVEDVFGGAPHFPSGYKLKKINSSFAWIADEKQYTNQAVFVYRYPAAHDGTDLSLGSIIAHRNEVLREQVPGMFDGTYMTTATFLEPTIEFLKYKGRDFAQVRGFWEVHNDFMGGPFVSHSFYSPDGSEIYVTEAFVYTPKYDKRQYLRQVESLLYSFDWKK